MQGCKKIRPLSWKGGLRPLRFFALVFILCAIPAYAESMCSEIFASTFSTRAPITIQLPEVGGDEWKRISVRYPDRADAIKDPEYLKNLHDSLADVFIPWFDQPSHETFADMLRRQHVILTSGRSGQHVYFGGSYRQKNIESGLSAKPGVFLNESSPSALRLVKAYINIKMDLNGRSSIKFSEADAALRKAGRERMDDMNPERLREDYENPERPPHTPPIHPGMAEAAAISLSMPGVPMAAWPKLYRYVGIKDSDYVHVYPLNENCKFGSMVDRVWDPKADTIWESCRTRLTKLFRNS